MKLVKQRLQIYLGLIFFVIAILCPVKPLHAAESVNWFEWPTVQEAVSLDKEWKVRLNQQVDSSSVTAENVTILDAAGVPCAIQPRLEDGGKTILIKPESTYRSGVSYQLLIKNLKSVNGEMLVKPVRLKFQTAAEENPVTLYNTILDMVNKVESTVDVSSFAKTPDEVFEALKLVLSEHPECKFYYDTATVTYGQATGLVKSLKVSYLYPSSTIAKMRLTLNNKVNQIVETETLPEMSPFEKEMAFHDYVVRNTVYDIDNLNNNTLPALAYSAYGVLVNGSGVCEGYAQAMQLLLNQVGIESRIVIGTGNGESHAWNMVKLSGKYYHLDTTWDDPIPDRGNNVSYAYFNLSDQLMSQNHDWDRSDYPTCTDLSQNYYYHNGWVAKDYTEFYTLLQKAIAQGDSKVTFLVQNYNPEVYDLTKAMKQAGFRGSYQYQINKELGIFTLSNITYN